MQMDNTKAAYREGGNEQGMMVHQVVWSSLILDYCYPRPRKMKEGVKGIMREQVWG